MRIVVVDDEPVALRGLASLLETDASVDIVAQCADGRAAIAAIRSLAPDVTLGSSSLAVAALQQDYGFSTIFPIALRCSISSWARRASANGMRAAMAGRTLPLPINSTARAMASRRGSSM